MERATDFAVGLSQYDDRQGYQHTEQGRAADAEEDGTGGARYASSPNKNPRPTGRDAGAPKTPATTKMLLFK